MDTAVESAMHVHRADGTLMTFQEYELGLYFYNAAYSSPNASSKPKDAYLFLHTVAGNKATYTWHEIEGADQARDLYRKLGHPSEQEFNKTLQNNFLRNCPVTPDDAKRALHIYDPDIAVLKGRTVKRQNRGIPNYQPIIIPAPMIDKYHDCQLFMDIFWVNGSPFHTISQCAKFRTAAAINNRYKRSLLMEARAVTNLYDAQGFNISRIEADQEFRCITNDLLPIPVNVAAADDHVAKVEQSIRTVKERVRCTVQGLPFRRIPKLMIRAVVEGAHKALNLFPARDGASDVMSPLTIMSGRPAPDYHDLKIEFGSYAHVFEARDPTNTNKTRSRGVVALNTPGNAQGGYFLMSLTTGRKISRQQWTHLPIPDGVIAAVEAVAAVEEQPIMGNSGPVFKWSPGVTIVDEGEPPILVDAP
jgi:hypothetical protein